MSLKGKTLFITGASRGIGLAIALRAAADGANIAIAAKTESNSERSCPKFNSRSVVTRRISPITDSDPNPGAGG
jgi:NAD(P)-dependent dehydrogenase (short-subunit alcohol dehydrogenase family)